LFVSYLGASSSDLNHQGHDGIPDELAADVPLFLAFKTLKPFVDKHLGDPKI
jgi:hypothetical protein